MDRDLTIDQLRRRADDADRRIAELERLVAALRDEVVKMRPAMYAVMERRT